MESCIGKKIKKKISRASLKYKIILGGCVAVIVPFLIAGTIIYFLLSHFLMERASEGLMARAEDTSELINLTLTWEIKLLTTIVADPDTAEALETGDYTLVQQELEQIHKSLGGDHFTIFLLDSEGIARADALFTDNLGLDLSDRDYFLEAKKGKSTVTGPLLSRGSVTPEAPILVLSVPVIKNNQFLGVAAVPINVDSIINTLEQRKVGETGYPYILNSEGLVLFHPRKEFILSLYLHELPGMEELKEMQDKGKSGTFSYNFEGFDKIAGMTQIPQTGWNIAFTQNKEEIMAPVNRILWTILFSGLVFLVITIVIIVISSGKISSPVQKMMEMMKEITRHSSDLIVQIGPDRKIVYANPAYEKVAGLSWPDTGTVEPELTNTNNMEPEEIWELLEKDLSWSGRIIVKNKEEKPSTLEVLLVPYWDNYGIKQGYLEIGRDITSQLMYEKKLQQSQKLEAVGTLAGGIAHDFNNILSGIFGFAELIIMEEGNGPQIVNYSKEIINASGRARDLISQILTFSRQTEVELRPLFPKTILKEALKLLRASIPSSIEIQSKLESESMIIAEPTQIYQAVMNLFMNASYAIGEEGGIITLELEDFTVDEDFIRIHPDIKIGKHIIIRISDTGKGIEPEVLEQIFEPFFTTKPQGKGTGLGLSVVHGIIKKINGIITVYSEPGKGTVFNIIIPVVETEAGFSGDSVQVLKKGSERVAVIDDEELILTTVDSILTNLGYAVTVYSDSLKALGRIKSHPEDFDIIITDYSMPHITGIEIAEALRKTGISIPIILTSGFMGKDTERAAQKAGITTLIRKPIDAYRLTDLMREILDKS